jgi:hypothetical protein
MLFLHGHLAKIRNLKKLANLLVKRTLAKQADPLVGGGVGGGWPQAACPPTVRYGVEGRGGQIKGIESETNRLLVIKSFL